MKRRTNCAFLNRCVHIAVATLISNSLHASDGSDSSSRTWKVTGTAAVKETFDSNVFLQSKTDKANRSSFVTSFLPSVGLNWKPASLLDLTVNYTPEAHLFHSESSEDFFLHRITLNLAGKSENTSYKIAGSVVKIDGSSLGPTWTGEGGAPATGAPIVRDRRDATVIRDSIFVTQQFGNWFMRPVATIYIHDFQMEHRKTAGYQNFADRDEFTFGADLGRYCQTNSFALVAGYRYGVQHQEAFLGNDVHYDSSFHRVSLGIEGRPLSWLKANVTIGPEFREFRNHVANGFGGLQRWNLFVDASLTATLSPADTLTLSAKRFEQPGSSGRATYQDGTYDLTLRHKLDEHWTVGVGGRGYNTDFRQPTKRDDWVISASAFVNYSVDKHFSAEASYVHEKGITLNSNASGREYDRHLVALGLKYTFQ